MIELSLEIDGNVKNLTLPSDYDELTVKQYQEISALEVQDLNDIEIIVKILTVLTNLTEDEVYMIPTKSFKEIAKSLEFAGKDIDKDMVSHLEVNGELYYLKKEFSTLNLGETISINTILENSQGDVKSCISKLLCIFLRKKKEDGSLEEFKNSFMEREELFNNVIISDVYQLFVFFLNTQNK